jgi:hypothetical protein
MTDTLLRKNTFDPMGHEFYNRKGLHSMIGYEMPEAVEVKMVA